MVLKGWSDKKDEVPHGIREFWTVHDELSIYGGIVYKGLRIVVPPSMRPAMLKQVHDSHLFIVKSKQRGKESLYWPGMSKQIEDLVSDCPMCDEVDRKSPKEPLISTKTPSFPWEQVASDILEFKSEHYLVVHTWTTFLNSSKQTN